MEKELRIDIKTNADLKGVDSVKRSFSELERESLRAVSAQRSVSSATSDTAKSVDHLSERIGFMGHAYVGFQAVMAGSSYMADLTKDAIRQADTWNLLEGRLKLVTNSTQQLVSVQADLFNVAQLTRSDYESTAGMYTRLALSMNQMGKSQEEIIRTTQTVNEAIAISGSTTQEASAAMMQLGQAIGSGKLQGDELRSIMENAQGLAQAIADGIGVPIDKLKDLGAEGKITSEVLVNALAKMASNMDEKFGKMPKTVGQSLTTLQNQIGLTIHEFDQMHGVTKSISDAISSATKTLEEHSNQIDDYIGYVGNAVSAILLWKGATIAFNGVQKAYEAYLAMSTVTTAAYSMAVGASAGSVTRLSVAQTAAIATTKALALATANPITATIIFGAVLTTAFQSARNFIEGDKVDPNGSAALRAAMAKTKELSSVENQARMVGAEYNKQSYILSKQLEGRASLVKAGINTNHIDAAIAKTRSTLKDIQKAAQEVYSVNEDVSKKPHKTTGIPTEKELKSAANAAEEYAKNYKSLQEAIFNINASDHDKAIKAINDQAAEYRKQKLPEVEVARYVSEAKSALNRKELDDLGKAMNESRKLTEEDYAKADQADQERYAKQIESANALYSAINELSDNWYDNELVNISNRAAEFAAAGRDDIEITKFVNASILKLDKKRYDEQAELAKKQWEDHNSGWISFFSDFEKAMDNQLFDAMTGKWESFGSWLKDFWSSITSSIARAASSQLANTLIGGMQNFLIGSPGQSSGLMRILAGGLGVGATLSADEIAQLGGTLGSEFTTSGGTVIDAAGQIIQSGSDIASLSNNISSLGSIFNIATNGLEATIAPALEKFASFMQATQFNVGSMTLSGGGAVLGAAGGYAIGSLGDKLFGADTKASTFGAIGGGIGGLFGPVGFAIGAGIGSVIGGLFGKTKTTDSGISFGELTGNGAGFDSIKSYADMKKKSWFSSKSWTDFADLSASDVKKIESIFDTYDYLLLQLGRTEHITLEAGKYSKETFQDQITKNFLSTFTGIEQKVIAAFASKDPVSNPAFDSIYNQWVDYAESIDKTVMQALTDSISTFIQSKRDFTLWGLERSGDTTEALRQKAQWLEEDFKNLESMIGVTGVTVENFTTMYEEAVKNSLDPNTISQWQSLGNALKSAADAQDAYNQALEQMTVQQQQNAINSFNTLGSAYSALSNTITNIQGMIREINGTPMTFAEAGYDPDKIMQAYRDQSAVITEQHNIRLNDLNMELNSIKKIADYSKTLANAAHSLRYNALSDSAKYEYSTATLDSLISSATGKLSTGADIADEVARITELSGNYAQLAQGYFTSQAEYDYAVGTMANKIEALGGSASRESSLADIEAAIIVENQYTNQTLESLKSETLNRLQGVIDMSHTAQQLIADQMMDMMDEFKLLLGDGSPIITTLKDILAALIGTGLGDFRQATEKWDNGIWRSTGGAIAKGTAESYTITTKDGQKISNTDAIGFVNSQLASGDPMAVYNAALATGISANSLDAMMGWAAGTANDWAASQNLPKFGDGGLVKGGKGGIIGQIGEKDYDELIIPLKNDPMNMGAVLAEMRALRDENKQLRDDMNKILAQIELNTKPSRYL